jgi:hypothetical protein
MMHKPSLELLDCCTSFVEEVLNACVDCLPHTYSCTYLFNKKKQKNEDKQGLYQHKHQGA